MTHLLLKFMFLDTFNGRQNVYELILKFERDFKIKEWQQNVNCSKNKALTKINTYFYSV